MDIHGLINEEPNIESNEAADANHDNSKRPIVYLCLFVASTLHLLLFSLWTSPLYHAWYGCDASFFTMVGRGITEGLVPYRDFFDLKGPYFFLLEAVGQLLAPSRTGAFILQVIFQYASVILIYETASLFLNRIKSLITVGLFLICHIATLWGGNTLEEFYLPFAMLCLYLFCRFMNSEHIGSAVQSNLSDKHNVAAGEPSPDASESNTCTSGKAASITFPTWFAILLGLCAGIAAFSKISVGAPVYGIIACVILLCFIHKNGKSAVIFALNVLLGSALATLPIILYFGINGCLSDMLHCVFGLGFKRSIDYEEAFNITWELKLTGCVFAFLTGLLCRKRIGRSYSVALISMSVITYLLLHLGTPYYYYFTTVYPCIILAFVLFLRVYDPVILFENGRQAAILIVFGIFIFYYIQAGLDTLHTVIYDNDNPTYEAYEQGARDLAALIPEFERDSVFSFSLDMMWYEINRITPCCRYQVNLPFFLSIDEHIQPDLLKMLNDEPPKWLVITQYFPQDMPVLAEEVYSNYSLVYENEVGQLWILD